MKDSQDAAAAGDLQIDAIGNVLLVTAGNELEGHGQRLEQLLDGVERSSRTAVLDLSAAGSLDPDVLKLLKMRWRGLGNRLRVVAPPGSGAADALRDAGLRRFAVHSTLSGALAQA